jgi:type VI secretion system protein ImpC
MSEIGTQTEAKVGGATTDIDEFASVLKQSFKPRTERAEAEVESALSTFVSEALEDQGVIQEEALDTINAMIARIDAKLTAQINEILHAPEFQQIEGAWRGLKHLVFNSETDSTLKLRFMNASKNELYRHLKKYPDANWDQSPLFKSVYEEEYGQLGGQPYGCIVGDYYFSQAPADVQLLGDMARIAAASHAPFIAGAEPELLQMDNWNELPKRRDLSTLFDLPDYAAWNSLRDSEDARYVALCMPRALGRLPYGRKSEPVDEIPSFEEDTDGHKGEKYCWINAAYAMAANINRAHKEYGWTVRIRGVLSGGEVEDLPTHVFPTDDGGSALAPL